MRCPTTYLPAVFDNDGLFDRLKNLPWKEGVRSKNGFTRMAHMVTQQDPFFNELASLIGVALATFKLNLGLKMGGEYTLAGIYVNYYKDGEMYTPNHTHPGTHQLIISLGGTRTLNVGAKSYQMSHGDCILFGSSVHGVPKEPAVKNARISIAAFLIPQ